MGILVIGLSHRTAPVEVRERMAFNKEEVGRAAAGLAGLPGIEEGLLLSTCNRTEALIALEHGLAAEAAVRGVRDFLCSARAVETGDLDRYLYVHHGAQAVRHLFRVASSLDSMMVGEPQILGQVKEAYAAGASCGALGPRLEALMQRTFSVAKRVRTSTSISRNPVSIAYAAADLAARIFGSLDGRTVMVLGAGKMADLAARHLITAGVRKVIVASRTFHHAQELAARFNGVPVTIDRFKDHLGEVDIVIASTAAPHHVLRKEDGPPMMRERRGRPIFIIDIAVPRDIDPALNKLDNLFLYDIDDLQRVVDAGMEERRREAVLAEAIVEEEVQHFLAQERSRDAAPAIVALREKLHAVAAEELGRFRGRLGPLSEKQEATVREMLSSVVNKMLHGPTREMKRSAGRRGTPEAVDLVRRMFDLPGPDSEPASREETKR
ncbi:MAG TPA: glutamyl-tRNA reductase [Candidatus Polarisedimenticolia bacterium]|nr:glutamyl-tRNA reductase [Candidatus Polarisedimenticolia bacterium]